MTNRDYHLVPTVGDTVDDVMRSFDGNSERLSQDPQACHDALVRSVSPLLRSRSVYEAPAADADTCLAVEAGAREGQRLGLSEISEVLTAPRVEQKAMVEHLAAGFEPAVAPPSPNPQPQYQSALRR